MKRSGFALTEGLVLGMILIGLLAILLPAATTQPYAQQRPNSIQLRGLHQALFSFAQENRAKGKHPGRFPGLDEAGEARTRADRNGRYRGNGTPGHVSERFAMLLNRNFIEPGRVVSPGDPDVAALQGGGELGTAHYSYAALSIASLETNRAKEWGETGNSYAAVLADRRGGGSLGPSESYWSRGEGKWYGCVLFNDSSVQYRESPTIEETQYGDGPLIGKDHLFEAAGPSDALLVWDGS